MKTIAPINPLEQPKSSARTEIVGLFKRAQRFVSSWLARMIADRERQAAIAVLRRLSDRQLKDIGIQRGQIESAASSVTRPRAHRFRP